MKRASWIIRTKNRIVSAGVPGVFPGETAGQPSCNEEWRRRGEKHEKRGALVRAEDTIYGHFVVEKVDRRGDEERRVSAMEEGRHVPRKDFSTGGQRFGGGHLRRGGAVLDRGGEVVQGWR